MKSFIIIAVLAALAVCNDAASISDEVAQFVDIVEVPEGVKEYEHTKDYKLEGVTSRKLSRDDDLILFYEESFNLEAIPNTVQHREVFYRGNSTTHIRLVWFHYHIDVLPELVETHLFGTHAFVKFTSWVGQGLKAKVQFFGLYTDWQ